jgi:hypothetical protein
MCSERRFAVAFNADDSGLGPSIASSPESSKSNAATFSAIRSGLVDFAITGCRVRSPLSGRHCDDDQREDDEEAAGEEDAAVSQGSCRAEGDDRPRDDRADASGVHVEAGRQPWPRNHLLEQGESDAGDRGEAPGVERLEGDEHDRPGDVGHREVVGDACNASGGDQPQAGEAAAEPADQDQGGDLEAGGDAESDSAQITSMCIVSVTNRVMIEVTVAFAA